MIVSTAQRVPANTAEHVNEQIRRRTQANVACFANASPAEIDRRLEELDHEWDIERWVETMAPTFTLIGLTLGLTVSRKWFVVPFAIQTFFLQHAIQGWCPPIPLLRRLGVRTIAEIDHERNALKALRGDYQNVHAEVRDDAAAREAFEAAER